MNDHPDTRFKTVIQNNREAIPFILDAASLDLEAVQIQMEVINQDIQYATSDYLVSTPTPEINILYIADDIINHIKTSIQNHRYYTESLTKQNHLTPGIRADARSTTSATYTASAPNTSSTTSPCKIPLKNHPIFSPHIYLTSQGKSLPQFQILHQVTLPKLNPHTYQNILQLKYLQKNLHQLFPPLQKSTLQSEIPQYFLIYTHLSSHQKNLPHFFFCTKFPLSQWISFIITISNPI